MNKPEYRDATAPELVKSIIILDKKPYEVIACQKISNIKYRLKVVKK